MCGFHSRDSWPGDKGPHFYWLSTALSVIREQEDLIWFRGVVSLAYTRIQVSALSPTNNSLLLSVNHFKSSLYQIESANCPTWLNVIKRCPCARGRDCKRLPAGGQVPKGGRC